MARKRDPQEMEDMLRNDMIYQAALNRRRDALEQWHAHRDPVWQAAHRAELDAAQSECAALENPYRALVAKQFHWQLFGSLC